MRRIIVFILSGLCVLFALSVGFQQVTAIYQLGGSLECGSAFSPDRSPAYTDMWAEQLGYEPTNEPSTVAAGARCSEELEGRRTNGIVGLGLAGLLAIWAFSSPTTAQVAARRAAEHWAATAYGPAPHGYAPVPPHMAGPHPYPGNHIPQGGYPQGGYPQQGGYVPQGAPYAPKGVAYGPGHGQPAPLSPRGPQFEQPSGGPCSGGAQQSWPPTR